MSRIDMQENKDAVFTPQVHSDVESQGILGRDLSDLERNPSDYEQFTGRARLGF